MNDEEYQIAMVDIGLKRSWEECRIKDKTPEKKRKWDILKKQIEDGWKKGYSLDIPNE